MAYQEVLTALADPTRRNILESLREDARTVGQIASDQPVSRPAVSQHLKVLQDAGLVHVKTTGTRRFYSVRREGLAELRTYLDRYWSDVLSAYGAEIERRLGDSNAGTDRKDN